jgi:DNA-binding MarR family transcriptional regulator
MQRQRLPQHEPVGLLVGAARRAIKQAVGRRVSRFRLTPQQFWLLVAIQEGRTTSLGQLAERMGGDQPTASRVVAALVRRKLVRVDEDPADRRRARLSPAPGGDALRPALSAVAAEIRAAVVRGMDAGEQEAVRAGLRKVISNMELLDREGPARRRRAGRRRSG